MTHLRLDALPDALCAVAVAATLVAYWRLCASEPMPEPPDTTCPSCGEPTGIAVKGVPFCVSCVSQLGKGRTIW